MFGAHGPILVVGWVDFYTSYLPLVVHFGLADETSIDEVTVRWVGGGTETITGLAPNGRCRVVEGSGVLD